LKEEAAVVICFDKRKLEKKLSYILLLFALKFGNDEAAPIRQRHFIKHRVRSQIN
jgi:hypothetical protein